MAGPTLIDLGQLGIDSLGDYIKTPPEEAVKLRVYSAAMFLSVRLNPLCARLGALPEDFRLAFLRLLGHTLVPAQITKDREGVVRDLLAITKGEENQAALATWSDAPAFTVTSRRCDIRHACYVLLQKLHDTELTTLTLQAMKFDVFCNGKHTMVDVIPTHLACSGIVAAGKVLHRSGSLILGDSAKSRNPDEKGERLWLFRERPDGVYATSVFHGHEPLRPSEIKDMRKWVNSYRGRKMRGKISALTFSDSRKICQSIGLTISGSDAYLGRVGASLRRRTKYKFTA